MAAIPFIKICCISSIDEAELAVRCGASALGLVSTMPSGPGMITEEDILKIASATPLGIETFLLTSLQDVNSIIEQHKRCGTTTIQLVDEITSGTYADLKGALPGVTIVQVIHVNGEESIDEAIKVAPCVDAILLDSGNQSLPVKLLGGTGRTHNWDISKRIVDAVDVPVYLAGGIKPDNIKEAFEYVKPYGIDLCSGVRTGNNLDEKKLTALFQNLT